MHRKQSTQKREEGGGHALKTNEEQKKKIKGKKQEETNNYVQYNSFPSSFSTKKVLLSLNSGSFFLFQQAPHSIVSLCESIGLELGKSSTEEPDSYSGL